MSDNIQVALRVRPLNPRELSETQTNKCIQVDKKHKSILLSIKSVVKQFTYDYVGDEDTTQEEIFESIGKPISNNCLTGYNGTIFAYGQTGSGKTHTIIGQSSLVSLNDHNSGILPRSLEYIFYQIRRETKMNLHIHYLVKCSFLEIYNENIRDLLTNDSRNLHIREDIKKGTYVEDLSQETVINFEETLKFLEIGIKARHSGSTYMNKESSRSHSVFTLYIESKELKDDINNYKSSLFHLIDLAGSERQKLTGTHGERLKEASMINKSLSTLGDVINALAENSEGKNRYVRYRDSKLTFLLKDSIGGKSKTCIIANVSPSIQSYGETLSTLRFAERAKFVKNQAVINEDNLGTILELKAEIRRLNQHLKLTNQQDVGVFDGKKVRELEEILQNNVQIRLQTESVLQQVINNKENEIEALNSVLRKYDDKMRNDKLKIKLKEEHIKILKSRERVYESQIIKELEGEIEILIREYENHPLAAKYFVENDSLKEYVKYLEGELKETPSSLSSRLKLNQEFTERLSIKLQESVQEKNKLDELVQMHLEKADSLKQELKDAQCCIDDLSSELELCKQKLLDSEEEASYRKISSMLIEAENNENFIQFHKKEAMKKIDINIYHTPKPNSHIFSTNIPEKNIICGACILKAEKISGIENSLNILMQQNNDLRFYEEESYRLAEDSKKIKYDSENKDIQIQQLLEENELLSAENDFLSSKLKEFSSELTEKNLYTMTNLQDNKHLRDELIEIDSKYVFFQGEYMKISHEMQESMQSREQMIEELRKLQNTEYYLQKECDELKSKLNEATAENQRLKREEDDLNKEVIKLSGHNNPNQKINYLSKLKREYNIIKDMNIKLKEEIQRKTIRIEDISRKYEKLAKANGLNNLTAEEEKERIRIETIEEELNNLNAVIKNITDFLYSLPYSRQIRSYLLENMIKEVIEYLTQEIEARQSSLQNKEKDIERKESYIKLLESNLLLCKQKNEYLNR